MRNPIESIFTFFGFYKSLHIVSEFELVWLKSGQRSIKSRAHGETMHVGSGPRTEANCLHVEQCRIVSRAAETEPFVIWDVGLGAGANALAALEALRSIRSDVELHSFEISTAVLEFALKHAADLDYFAGWESIVESLLKTGQVQVFAHLRWVLHRGDFRAVCADAPMPCAIFFDPYSPAQNPAMWSLDVFEAIHARTGPGTPCIMTTYTRSTAIRAAMLLAGWFVGAGVPTGDKTETTIAANSLELLERPLDQRWLSRARKSTAAAPIRGGIYAQNPICEEDFARLAAHPQFAQ